MMVVDLERSLETDWIMVVNLLNRSQGVLATGSRTTKISRSKLVEVNGTATTGAMSTQEGVRMRLFPRKQAGPGQKLPVKNMTTYGFKI